MPHRTLASLFVLSLCLLLNAPAHAKDKPGDIVDTAVAADGFDTLVAAVKAAGLVETLKDDGPFTVFAPTDEAFAALPEGTVEALLKPENKDALVSVLTYHVVAGKVGAGDAVKLAGKSAGTVQGAEIAVSVAADGKSDTGMPVISLKINDATVVAADINASNGVIHVIDTVLLPPDLELNLRSLTNGQKLIELAIERGVPLFNRGDRDACAAVYEVALTGLLADPELSDKDRRLVESTLKRADEIHDAGRKAWMFRFALDKLYESMGETMSEEA